MLGVLNKNGRGIFLNPQELKNRNAYNCKDSNNQRGSLKKIKANEFY